MTIAKITCPSCKNKWEVTLTDIHTRPDKRACPSCGKDIDIPTWTGTVVLPLIDMESAERKLQVEFLKR